MARYFSLSRHASKAIIMAPGNQRKDQRKNRRKMPRAKARNMRIVLVTCSSLPVARRIARSVVQKRLAACVNVVRSPVESFYAWKGGLESAREHLLLIKTTVARLRQLEKEVKRLHTYEVPEFLILPIAGSSQPYMKWLADSLM